MESKRTLGGGADVRPSSLMLYRSKIAAKNRGGGEKLPHTTMTHTLSVMNYAGTRRPTFSREIEFSSFKER